MMSDVKVTDEDGLLSRSMMIKASNTIMKERIWINRVASKIVFQPGIPLYDVVLGLCQAAHLGPFSCCWKKSRGRT